MVASSIRRAGKSLVMVQSGKTALIKNNMSLGVAPTSVSLDRSSTTVETLYTYVNVDLALVHNLIVQPELAAQCHVKIESR